LDTLKRSLVEVPSLMLTSIYKHIKLRWQATSPVTDAQV
jgi:hypothetical protein